MKCLFFQVQARPQKEVSLLDLDDCEFQLKQELQHPLENSSSLIAVVALTRYVFYSPKLGFEIFMPLLIPHCGNFHNCNNNAVEKDGDYID